MFSVLSLAIKARSTSSTRVYSMDRLERRGGRGGVSNCIGRVIDPVLP